eukprot:4499284-Amphidinium_carterae.1
MFGEWSTRKQCPLKLGTKANLREDEEESEEDEPKVRVLWQGKAGGKGKNKEPNAASRNALRQLPKCESSDAQDALADDVTPRVSWATGRGTNRRRKELESREECLAIGCKPHRGPAKAGQVGHTAAHIPLLEGWVVVGAKWCLETMQETAKQRCPN